MQTKWVDKHISHTRQATFKIRSKQTVLVLRFYSDNNQYCTFHPKNSKTAIYQTITLVTDCLHVLFTLWRKYHKSHNIYPFSKVNLLFIDASGKQAQWSCRSSSLNKDFTAVMHLLRFPGNKSKTSLYCFWKVQHCLFSAYKYVLDFNLINRTSFVASRNIDCIDCTW